MDTLCGEWQLPLYASLTLRCEGGKRGGGEALWGQWAIRRGKGFTNKSEVPLLEGWENMETCPVSYRL